MNKVHIDARTACRLDAIKTHLSLPSRSAAAAHIIREGHARPVPARAVPVVVRQWSSAHVGDRDALALDLLVRRLNAVRHPAAAKAWTPASALAWLTWEFDHVPPTVAAEVVPREHVASWVYASQ